MRTPFAKCLPFDFELRPNFETLIAQVDDHEFAQCIFAPGDVFIAGYTGWQVDP
ncbi:hypothetical protein JQ631_10645 [Bradyrhizobium manausense]|jgi:hypothetical protein|uniref:hypothetical protein n=1 Tax=Bradyrhizobium manausense TaxID=989370 RepID=UPI001BACB433|nr:hypothetical protein [Bradyrhizobium manausense]MBR0789528.1 hypothetical protein [Bradyrhizobium manausense]